MLIRRDGDCWVLRRGLDRGEAPEVRVPVNSATGQDIADAVDSGALPLGLQQELSEALDRAHLDAARRRLKRLLRLAATCGPCLN
jgi:hypothetical protein